MIKTIVAEHHSSVGSVPGLRTGRLLLDPQFCQYSVSGDDSHYDNIHFSPTAVLCFDNNYVAKQPVDWKEYCAEY